MFNRVTVLSHQLLSLGTDSHQVLGDEAGLQWKRE